MRSVLDFFRRLSLVPQGITIVVAGYQRSARAQDHVGAVLARAAEGMRLKDAAAEVAAATGARKNDLYKAALAAK